MRAAEKLMQLHPHDDFRFQRAIDLLLEVGGVIDTNSVWMDLGCHQGQFLKKIISQFSVRGIGSDDWNESQKSPEDSHWEYFKADLDQYCPGPEEVDVISAFEVLEHMIDTDGFLRRIFEKLKPGGYVLISTPNINSLRNRVMVPFGAYPVGLEYRNQIHHVRLYNARILHSHLRDSGFIDIRVRGVSFLPLSTPFGASRLSAKLADLAPSLCNNILAVGRKPLSIELDPLTTG